MIIPFNWRNLPFTGWKTDVVQSCIFSCFKVFDLSISGSFSLYCRRVCFLWSHTRNDHKRRPFCNANGPSNSSHNFSNQGRWWSVFRGDGFGKPRNLCKSLDVRLIQWLGWLCFLKNSHCCDSFICFFVKSQKFQQPGIKIAPTWFNGKWIPPKTKTNIAFSFTRKGPFLQNNMDSVGANSG